MGENLYSSYDFQFGSNCRNIYKKRCAPAVFARKVAG